MDATISRVHGARRHARRQREATTRGLRTVGSILTLALSIFVAPLATDAQPSAKVPRIGFLMMGTPAPTSPFFEAFRQQLRKFGYVEGENLVFEDLWAQSFEGLQMLAGELVRRKADVIVAPSTAAIWAAKRATTTVPIVILSVGDPVAQGFVTSLAWPGGNITGVGGLSLELSGKLLELLIEAVPRVTRVAVFGPPGILASHMQDVEATARSLGVQPSFLEVQGPDKFERAFTRATREGAGALLLLPAMVFAMNERQLAALAIQHRLPAIFWRRTFAEAGGLMSYGSSQSESWQRAAELVGKILKGVKPADLPVEQPTTFELVINLQTAKALNLTIPPSILFQANEVIK